MIETESKHNVTNTMDKLETVIADKGINVVARVNHAKAAKKVGMDLRPTETLIFGNPLLGTPLMQSSQSASMDLPLRVAVWEDESGKIKIGYHDPAIVASSHGINNQGEIVAKMTAALEGLVSAASS